MLENLVLYLVACAIAVAVAIALYRRGVIPRDKLIQALQAIKSYNEQKLQSATGEEKLVLMGKIAAIEVLIDAVEQGVLHVYKTRPDAFDINLRLKLATLKTKHG